MKKTLIQPINVRKKIACITLDYELDYGDRVGRFNILNESRRELETLKETFRTYKVPVSAFITTQLLDNSPGSYDLVRELACDYHLHSHTHNTHSFDSEYEIEKSVNVFSSYFNDKPIGYRAPQGRLYAGDIDLLKKEGVQFSSSIFPSWRFGKFNHLLMPTIPFVYSNGVIELPFAVIPYLRYVVSLSYLKLLGMNVAKGLFAMFGLPKVLVFDSHLCDYIVNENSYKGLPSYMKLAYAVNKYKGIEIFKDIVTYLKKCGYEFMTMTELFQAVKGCQ